MSGALLCRKEACSDLDSVSSEHESCSSSPAVAYSSCGDYRDVEGIHNLRNERHGVQFAYVSAGLCAFCNDCVSACRLHLESEGNRCNHRNHLYACRLPHFHVLGRRSGSGGEDFHAFLDYHLRYFSRIWSLEHDVDAEWLICHFLTFPDFISHSLGTRIH